MSLAQTWSVSVSGLVGTLIEVEADLGTQLPRFSIIGMADRSLHEAEDRVKQAVINSGAVFPNRRLTVNLAPAELPKRGTGFDLAIALAALATSTELRRDDLARCVHIGELGLDGRLRSVRGVLPACLAALRDGISTVMVPSANAAEAKLASGSLTVHAVTHLRDALRHYGASLEPEPALRPASSTTSSVAERTKSAGADEVSITASSASPVGDLNDVRGNTDALFALQVAAAGGHHLSMFGPPGTGKSMMAERMVGLLPDLDDDAAREVSCIRSIVSGSPLTELELRPPYVAPHHTASAPALLGGGSSAIRPGAVTLAHRGLLFLDEAPEMNTSVLNALREPLETGEVRLHRARTHVVYPARFQLVTAANPCPCGYSGSSNTECRCTPEARRRYDGRMSGPLRDRIDLHVRVDRATHRATNRMSSTADLRRTVAAARRRAAARLSNDPVAVNARVSGRLLDTPLFALDRSAQRRLDDAVDRGRISLRGYDRVRRVAWTIADLTGSDRPTEDDVTQALYFRGDSHG